MSESKIISVVLYSPGGGHKKCFLGDDGVDEIKWFGDGGVAVYDKNKDTTTVFSSRRVIEVKIKGEAL